MRQRTVATIAADLQRAVAALVPARQRAHRDHARFYDKYPDMWPSVRVAVVTDARGRALLSERVTCGWEIDKLAETWAAHIKPGRLNAWKRAAHRDLAAAGRAHQAAADRALDPSFSAWNALDLRVRR